MDEVIPNRKIEAVIIRLNTSKTIELEGWVSYVFNFAIPYT